MKKRLPHIYKYYVNLPKTAKSPTNSIYKFFDIESQSAVLNHTGMKSGLKLESDLPFVVKYLIKKKLVTQASKVKV